MFFFQFDSETRDNGFISSKLKENLNQELEEFKSEVIQLNMDNKSKFVEDVAKVAVSSAVIGAVGSGVSVGASALFKAAGNLMSAVGTSAVPVVAETSSTVMATIGKNIGAAFTKVFK